MSKQAMIAKLHIAKTQLGMADDDYRAMLQRHGAASSKDMSVAQLESVLQELQAKGFKPTSPGKAGKRKQAKGELIGKIRALWLFLFELEAVKDPSEAALASFASRMVKVDDLHWVDDRKAFALIEILKKWVVRVLPARITKQAEFCLAAGLLPRSLWMTGHALDAVSSLSLELSPRLDPNSFDALRNTYDHLQDLEHGRAA